MNMNTANILKIAFRHGLDAEIKSNDDYRGRIDLTRDGQLVGVVSRWSKILTRWSAISIDESSGVQTVVAESQSCDAETTLAALLATIKSNSSLPLAA